MSKHMTPRHILRNICMLISATMFSITVAANSKNMFIKNNLNSCNPPKISYNNYEPSAFNPSNNLLRKTGRINHANKQEIIIKGRLLDKNCVPISDAKVYTWHASANGTYPYEPLKNNINQDLISEESEDGFQGSGVYTTNNLGEFVFISIYPGEIKTEMPHINIKAVHEDYGSFQTKVYLKPIFQVGLEHENEEVMSYYIKAVLANEKHSDNLSLNEPEKKSGFLSKFKSAPTRVELKARKYHKARLKTEKGYLIVLPDSGDDTYKFDLITPFQNKFRRY